MPVCISIPSYETSDPSGSGTNFMAELISSNLRDRRRNYYSNSTAKYLFSSIKCEDPWPPKHGYVDPLLWATEGRHPNPYGRCQTLFPRLFTHISAAAVQIPSWLL